MKKWWIGYTGPGEDVQEVVVVGPRNTGTEWEAPVVRLADGTIEDANRGSVFETEWEARRGRVLSEAEDLEDEARNAENAAEHCQDMASRELARVAEYKASAAELRARAKGIRDSLDEVRDAVEGRR